MHFDDFPTLKNRQKHFSHSPTGRSMLCRAFSDCCKDKLDVWGDIGFHFDEARAETSASGRIYTFL